MKLKHLFLTFSFVVGIFSVAFAQQQQTALNVTTTSTLDTLDFAGREQAHFVTNIANTATDGSSIFIDNMQLTLPDGFELVSLQLKKGETTLFNDVTSMQLNDTLKVMESYTLDYNVRPTCNAIPTNISNQFSIRCSNNLKITYIEQNALKIKEYSTNSYNFLIPNMNLSIGKSTANTNNNVKEIYWQTPVTDTFTIKCTEGAGPISNMRVSMRILQNNDAFSEIKFFVANQEYVPIHADGMYNIDLTTSDFQNAGLGNTFNGGENLNVVVSFKPTKFYLQTQVKYIARVKNGSDICNEQTNASAVRSYLCSEPNVKLSATMDIIQQANYCGRDFICDVTFTNTSENVITNTLTNAQFIFYNSGYEIISVQHNGAEIAPISNRQYSLPTNDVNGDNIPDIQPQESCTVRIIARLTAPISNINFVVRFMGYTIDGSEKRQDATAYSSLSVQNFSLLSPSDSRGDDTATYHYDIRLQTIHYFYQRELGFLDVDYIGLMYDDTVRRVFDISEQNFSDSDTISIIASCDKPQLFKMVVRTNECDIFYIKDSRTGNSIVECPDSLYGSDCMSIRTIDVSPITPQQINTCETFTINASGELAYWCSDTCPKPQRIMAHIYDLDETLQFESVTCSISVNGSSYGIQPSNELAINNGIAWSTDIIPSFPCSDTLNRIPLQLTAQVFIKGNHELPNMSNHNIRVLFSAESDENTIYIANSKGSMLTVYDPELDPSSSSFPYYLVKGNASVSLSMTMAAASASQHPIRLTHIELPAVEGYYYTTTSEVGEPFSVDISNEFAYNTLNDSQTAEFIQSIRALCTTDGTPYDGSLQGTYTYTDYYASCRENETFTKDFAWVYTLQAPVIEMDSSMEQGLTKYTSWNVFVRNTGHAEAPNVTLRIKPNENNVTELNIESVSVNNIAILNPDYKIIDDVAYVRIGNIPANQNKPIKVTITMSSCSGEGFSYLDVTAIWTCENIMQEENIDEEFELRNCNNFSTRLKLENMKAELSVQERYPTQKFKLCQNIPIHLDIYNSGRANLSNVGFVLSEDSFSDGVEIVDNLIYNKYNYDSYNIPVKINSISLITDIREMDTLAILSQRVLGNSKSAELPARNFNENIISTDFSVVVHCTDSTLIEPLEFKVSALTNCGELQEERLVYNLPLEGLDQIQMVGVTSLSTPFTVTQSNGIAEGIISMTIANNSMEPLENPIVGVELPDGLIVTTQSGSESIQGFSIQTSQKSNGATTVRLIAPASYSVPANSSRTFSLTLQENKRCPNLESIAEIYAEIPVEVASDCGSESCLIRARTERNKLRIQRLNQPVIITISGADTVCQSAEVILTASGADNYVWDDGSQTATTTVTYPTTTYHVVGTTTEGCSGEAEHTIVFVENIEQPQLALVVGTDTITNGIVQYADWNALGEEIIHVLGDENGTLTKINGTDDNGCGTYTYEYTVANHCDTLSSQISFTVENCVICDGQDLVEIEGKEGFSIEDLYLLDTYIKNPSLLHKTANGYEMTISDGCIEKTYQLSECFLENSDINKDGVIDLNDKNALFLLIVEQSNK